MGKIKETEEKDNIENKEEIESDIATETKETEVDTETERKANATNNTTLNTPKHTKKSLREYALLIVSCSLFLLFFAYTVCVKFIDVKAIGPNGSSVGFATLNEIFNNLIGHHLTLYVITDWASIVPTIFATIFAISGLVQWIKRKNILKVDGNILALGINYALAGVVYFTFQFLVIDRRPVILNNCLESSFPSSTTVLSLCFLVALFSQVDRYIKSKKLKLASKIFLVAFCAFLIVGRICAGVHWVSDIIGGMIVSSAILTLYFYLNKLFLNLQNRQ